MSDARNTMETRLQSLSQEARNTLYALKLLREAGIGPPTHQRVKSVLITIFQYEESIRLLAMLEELSKNAFIKPPSIRDPIRPEEAYLDKVVTYIDGKNPRDDFNALSTTLINIKDAEGLHYLAITLSMSGEYSKAYSHLEQAVAFKDNFYEAWYTMGLICYEVGNKLDTKNQPTDAILSYKLAIQNYEEAIKIKSDYYQAWNNLGIIYKMLGQYNMALNIYGKALNKVKKTDSYKPLYNRGNLFCEMERYENGIKDFREAVKIKPDYHQAWDNLAYTFVILKQYDEALEAIQEARQLDPDNIKYWATLGVILSYLEREDAVLWLCKAWRAWGLVNTPTVDEVNRKLGEAFARLGISPANCIN